MFDPADDDFDAPAAPNPQDVNLAFGDLKPLPVDKDTLAEALVLDPLSVRNAILLAFRNVGGWRYLAVLANSAVPSDRASFMSLVSKLIPTKIDGSVSMGITVNTVNYAVERAAQAVINKAARLDDIGEIEDCPFDDSTSEPLPDLDTD